MNLILQVVGSVVGLIAMLVGKRAATFFASATRRQKAELIKTFAMAALSYTELQKGVSTSQADLIRYAINELYTKLVQYGFNQSIAKETAASAIAAAAAEKGYDLKLIEPLVGY